MARAVSLLIPVAPRGCATLNNTLATEAAAIVPELLLDRVAPARLVRNSYTRISCAGGVDAYGRPFSLYRQRTIPEDRDDKGRPLPDNKRVTVFVSDASVQGPGVVETWPWGVIDSI